MTGYIGKVIRNKEGFPTNVEIVESFDETGELIPISIPDLVESNED